MVESFMESSCDLATKKLQDIDVQKQLDKVTKPLDHSNDRKQSQQPKIDGHLRLSEEIKIIKKCKESLQGTKVENHENDKGLYFT